MGETVRHVLTLIFIGVFSTATFAQYNLGFSPAADGITFQIDASTLSQGGIGGFSTPQASEIDLNFDGVMDLFIFDRANDVMRTYLYQTSTGDFVYAPEYEHLFPSDLKEFTLLRDFDCDGHMDIFTYYLAGFRVYRNNGTSPLGFTKVTDKIRTDYGSITTGAFVLSGDVPAIVDVDSDGDLDILTFGSVNAENTIEFHRNLSQDLYNNCDSLEFEVVTQCWGKVEEPNNSSTLVELNCKGVIPPSGGRGEKHPGSTVFLFDADNDGDKDLVVGDIQTDRLVFAVNVGDASSATIDVNQQTTDFPNATDPVIMQYLVSAFHVDVDHDGKHDLLLSVNNSIDSSVNTGHLWYYRDAGSTVPDFSLQTKEFLLEDMLDLGSSASLEVMDVNGDGDEDLLIANDYRRTPTGATKSRIYYFENVGGSFVLQDDDFANISNFNFQATTLSLGDLDGDGDQDLLLGVDDGYLHYFRNTPSGGMANFSLTEPEYMDINTIGSNAAPEIADVNGDGLLDLLIGERIGTISYFENTGTATSPSFISSATIEDIGRIDVSKACCVGHAQPRWIDDPNLSSGKVLMVGSDEKRVLFYRVPNDLNDPFPLLDSILINSGRLSPYFVDFDEDGVYELLAGTAEGGVRYFERDENVLIGIASTEEKTPAFNMFPNPANETVTIELDRVSSGVVQIHGIDGRLIKTESWTSDAKMKLDVSDLKSGIYLIKVLVGSMSKTQRLIIFNAR